MNPVVSLRTLTLNCWGVPLVTKYRTIRFKYIAEELSKGEYDVIAFQEVVYSSDYKMLCEKMANSHPYQHYFHSGIKSGVCIFSNCPIVDSAIFHYSINSSPYRVHELDWYARKMLGMVKIKHQALFINVFATHVCGVYTPCHMVESDILVAHRLAQCYEMSNIIRQVGPSADVNILMGDFNSEPFSLAKKVLMANADLKDVWDERPNSDDGSGETCECDYNKYTGLVHRIYEKFPKGMRLDYIMYNARHGVKVECRDSRLALRKIPGTELNPSDHEAVSATFEIQYCKDSDAPNPSEDLASLLEDVEKKFMLACDAIQKKRIHSSCLVAFLALILFIIQLTSIADFLYGKFIISAVLFIAIFQCVWHICVQETFNESTFKSLLQNVRIRKAYLNKFKNLKINKQL